jgi:predicted ATP-grasp superfamily ATP-dependent carboligase
MMRPRHDTVLALGTGITLLGVIRALAQARVGVYALPEADGPARRSRWFRAGPTSLAGLKPSGLADALGSLPVSTVLMPCSDAWVKSVAALPDELRKRYPASVAPLDAVNILVDKNRFRDTLARLRLPHPTTYVLKEDGDLDAVPDSTVRSSFLKPTGSQEFFARFHVKAFRIQGREDAKRRVAECRDAGFEMMLQDYIPGPPTNHYFIDGFVDRDGIVRARFARRRLRMSPPDFGNSTLMQSVPLADVETGPATLDALFASIGYRGVFSAEFKRDERNRQFNLIEVNARPWWYVEFAARCGVNVCELAVDDALGRPVRTISSYKVGRRCVFPYYDLYAQREATGGRIGLLAAARSWLGAYQPVFRWSDPAPAFNEVARILRGRLR